MIDKIDNKYNNEVKPIEGLAISGFVLLFLYSAYIFIIMIGKNPLCNDMFTSFHSVLNSFIRFLPIIIFIAASIFFLLTFYLIKNLKVSLPGIYWFNNILSLIVLIISAFGVYKYTFTICDNKNNGIFKLLNKIITPAIIVFTLMGFEMNFIVNYQTDG